MRAVMLHAPTGPLKSSRSCDACHIRRLQAALQLATVRPGPSGAVLMRMRQSISQFESAFEQETSLERRRREQLRRRAANRSRARRITRTEQQSKVRFSVLAVCLTVTVVVVVVAMFEALAFLMA